MGRGENKGRDMIQGQTMGGLGKGGHRVHLGSVDEITPSCHERRHVLWRDREAADGSDVG